MGFRNSLCAHHLRLAWATLKLWTVVVVGCVVLSLDYAPR